MTFMNLSGEATGGLLRYFKIDVADGKLHSFAVRVPEEQDLVRSALTLGQLSSRGAHALARCRR